MPTLPEVVTDLVPQLHAIPPFRGEYRPPQFQTVDLLALNDQSFRELQRQVYRERRHLQVLVQPWHKEYDPETVFPATDQYQVERDQFIATAFQKGVPLLIFEQSSQYQQIARRVGANEGVVYTVRTREKDPTPTAITEYTDNWPFWSPRELARAKSLAWSRVTQPLKEAGVKDVTVGGRLLVLHEATNQNGRNKLEQLRGLAKGKSRASEWLDRGLIPGGNVGNVAYRFLAAGFDVSLSPISSPARTLEPTDLSSVSHMQNIY